jgi:15-cis-phytoene synthase
MTPAQQLAADRDFCRTLTQSRGANFSVGFRFLPRRKREAIYAAYAFCRFTDDLADEQGVGDRAAALDAWERELEACYRGTPTHPVSRALAASLAEFPIPQQGFADLLAGCRRDLVQTRYPTYDDLLEYCREVAVSISEISLGIFGTRDVAAHEHGRHLALGLQLTNILRDVAEDLERDRIYLPLEELARFGVGEDGLRRGLATPGVRELLAFQSARALHHFRAAAPLLDCIDPDARRTTGLLGAVYVHVLREIQHRDHDVFHGRVRLSTPRKIAIAARGVLRPRIVAE